MNVFVSFLYIAHAVFLAFYVVKLCQSRKHKSQNKIEAVVTNRISDFIIPSVVGLLIASLPIVLVYAGLITTGENYIIIATGSISLLFPISMVYSVCWRIELRETDIVKYTVFKKRVFRYSDITEIEQGPLVYTVYSHRKKIFVLNAQVQDFDLKFIETLKERAAL